MSEENNYSDTTREFLIERIAERTGVRQDVVEAADMSDDTLSDMYNRLSKGEKVGRYVALPAAVVFLGSLAYGALGGDAQSNAFLATMAFSFLTGFTAAQYSGGKIQSVRHEVESEATDALVELRKQKLQP